MDPTLLDFFFRGNLKSFEVWNAEFAETVQNIKHHPRHDGEDIRRGDTLKTSKFLDHITFTFTDTPYLTLLTLKNLLPTVIGIIWPFWRNHL